MFFENIFVSVVIVDSDLFIVCCKEKYFFKSVFLLINICENKILLKYELWLYFKEMGGISWILIIYKSCCKKYIVLKIKVLKVLKGDY